MVWQNAPMRLYLVDWRNFRFGGIAPIRELSAILNDSFVFDNDNQNTTINMTKSISLIAICYLMISCNQNPKATQDKELITSDTLKNLKSVRGDTTKLNMDAIKSSTANFKLLLENEYVRVLEYSLKPGQKDKPHTHPAKSSYVVSGGKLKVYLENGETIIADEETGTASWGDYAGKHYVENIGNTTVTIILTEIKSLE